MNLYQHERQEGLGSHDRGIDPHTGRDGRADLVFVCGQGAGRQELAQQVEDTRSKDEKQDRCEDRAPRNHHLHEGGTAARSGGDEHKAVGTAILPDALVLTRQGLQDRDHREDREDEDWNDSKEYDSPGVFLRDEAREVGAKHRGHNPGSGKDREEHRLLRRGHE